MNFVMSRETYEGEWKNERKHGYGISTMTLPTSKYRYEGHYENGVYHGKGKMTCDHSSYEGDYLYGKRHGNGTVAYVDGSTYSGAWEKGLFEGYGARHEMGEGDYLGYWSQGLMHGEGRLCYFSGEIYDGLWHFGRMHGKGCFTKADGTAIEGVWSSGKLIEKTLCPDMLLAEYLARWNLNVNMSNCDGYANWLDGNNNIMLQIKLISNENILMINSFLNVSANVIDVNTKPEYFEINDTDMPIVICAYDYGYAIYCNNTLKHIFKHVISFQEFSTIESSWNVSSELIRVRILSASNQNTFYTSIPFKNQNTNISSSRSTDLIANNFIYKCSDCISYDDLVNNGIWIEQHLHNPLCAVGYTITSANDVAGRDITSWKMLAKFSDSLDWEEIHTIQTKFLNRCETLYFNFPEQFHIRTLHALRMIILSTAYGNKVHIGCWHVTTMAYIEKE
jgi:hypothetical protein